MGSKSVGPGTGTSRILTAAVILLLGLALLSALQMVTLENDVSLLQSQASDNHSQLSQLQSELVSVAYMVRSTTQTQTPGPALSFQLLDVCVSLQAVCDGRYAYSLRVFDDGNGPIRVNSSVFISFDNASRLTYFGFNATLPRALAPEGSLFLNSTGWSQYPGAASMLATGDVVTVGASIGSYSTNATTTVYGCTTTTTTFVNNTRTQTATGTTCR